MTTAWNLAVKRDDLSATELFDVPIPEVGDGEALLRVDRVGVTANNVTYALLGDAMHYWDFFPTKAGYGLVPLWGFGEVLESAAEGVTAGARVYGYFPSGSHLLVRPGNVRRDAVSRREPAPRAVALAVQQLHGDDDRSCVRRRPRGSADSLPPAVLHLLHARRPARGQRVLRRGR